MTAPVPAPLGNALEVRGLCVRAGRVDIVTGVDLDLKAGSVTGLIGPNGAGKTTVVDAVSGLAPGVAGRVTLNGVRIDGLPPHRRARLGLARTFQALELFEDLTVAENLLVAAPSATVPTDLAAVAGARPAHLTSAQRRRLALARATAGNPAVLLLDEPAAGLDAAERESLASRIREVAGHGTAVLLVDHDMGLVLDVCDQVSVMDRGRVIATGTPDQVRSDERVVETYLGSPPAEDARAGGAPAASGGPVLEVRGLTAGYGDALVVRDVDLVVRAGEVVALLGLNGAGKTTTLRAISAVVTPRAGDVRVLGAAASRDPRRLARLGMAHVPQERSVFDELTVAENLRLAGDPALALSAFPALEPLLRRRAGLLSGGESRMVALGRALSTRPRLLLVDEPTLGLAPSVVADLLATVRRAAVDQGTAVLLVEQHLHRAVAVADRAYVMERGRIVGEGPAGEVALDGVLPG